jgi:hypothetical protein
MPETLKLNDGTVLENASAILSGDLFLYVNGQDMRTVFDLLIDPEKTDVIIYIMNNGDNKRYSGFTKLTAVTDEGNGMITAVLRKEVTE